MPIRRYDTLASFPSHMNTTLDRAKITVLASAEEVEKYIHDNVTVCCDCGEEFIRKHYLQELCSLCENILHAL